MKHIVLHTVNNSNDLWGIPRANSLRNWFICNYPVVCNVEATVFFNILSLLFLPDCKRRTPARVLPRVHLHSWSAQLQHQRNQDAPEGSCRQVTQSGNGCLSVCEFSLQMAALTITGWVLHTYILRNFRFLFQAFLSAGQNLICSKVITHIQGPIKRMYQWWSSMRRLEPKGSPRFINRSQQRRRMVHLLMSCGIT